MHKLYNGSGYSVWNRFWNFITGSMEPVSTSNHYYTERSIKRVWPTSPLARSAYAVLWRHNSAHKDAMFVVTLVLCDTKCASAN